MKSTSKRPFYWHIPKGTEELNQKALLAGERLAKNL